MGDAVSIRGKRYAIDAEKLLKDTDVYFLAYKGRLSTDSLKSQLKEGKLNYSHFHALKDAGFNIEDYWIKDSPINTVQVDDKLLYSLLEDFKKYKKLANSIEGFMSVKLYKPLKGYMEFCDSINCSYTKLCNDEDYLIWFDELEKKQYKGIADPPSPISTSKETKTADNKPKAYIKNPLYIHNQQRLDEINEKLDYLTQKSFNPFLNMNWSDYGDDYNSIIGILIHDGEMSESSFEMLVKHIDKLEHDLQLTICNDLIRELYPGLRVVTPTIGQHISTLRNIYFLKKAHEHRCSLNRKNPWIE